MDRGEVGGEDQEPFAARVKAAQASEGPKKPKTSFLKIKTRNEFRNRNLNRNQNSKKTHQNSEKPPAVCGGTGQAGTRHGVAPISQPSCCVLATLGLSLGPVGEAERPERPQKAPKEMEKKKHEGKKFELPPFKRLMLNFFFLIFFVIFSSGSLRPRLRPLACLCRPFFLTFSPFSLPPIGNNCTARPPFSLATAIYTAGADHASVAKVLFYFEQADKKQKTQTKKIKKRRFQFQDSPKSPHPILHSPSPHAWHRQPPPRHYLHHHHSTTRQGHRF